MQKAEILKKRLGPVTVHVAHKSSVYPVLQKFSGTFSLAVEVAETKATAPGLHCVQSIVREEHGVGQMWYEVATGGSR